MHHTVGRGDGSGKRAWAPFVLGLAACAHGQPPPRPAAGTPPPARVAPPAAPTGTATQSPCAGPRLDLLAAIADRRCRIGEDEADELRKVVEDPARARLRVDATPIGDDRVLVRIRNQGATALAVPLFVHSAVDAFPATADDRPLAAPVPSWPEGFSFDTGRMLSKVVLPPGGVADATIRIDPRVVSETPPPCPPNAKCAPGTAVVGRLRSGHYVLRIRTPIYSGRDDLVATSRWVGPGTSAQRCPGPTTCPAGQVAVQGCPGGMPPRPGSCPPAERCVPANQPPPECPALP